MEKTHVGGGVEDEGGKSLSLLKAHRLKKMGVYLDTPFV